MDFFENRIEYIKSPLNYTGSKFKLLSQLFPRFPSGKTLIDLFCGGGSVFINSENEKIIANDIVSPLIDFYIELQRKDWSFIEKEISLRRINKDSQDQYLELRERFNTSGNCYDFFVLVCSCTNNMMRFNKSFKFNQTWGKRTYNEKTREKLHKYWQRLHGNTKIQFVSKKWNDVEIPNDSFVYLDPPYLISEAGYNAYWSREDEDGIYDLLDRLDSCGTKWAFSNVSIHKGKVNPYMERLLKYNVVELNHNYDKVSRKENEETKEILATN